MNEMMFFLGELFLKRQVEKEANTKSERFVPPLTPSLSLARASGCP